MHCWFRTESNHWLITFRLLALSPFHFLIILCTLKTRYSINYSNCKAQSVTSIYAKKDIRVCRSFSIFFFFFVQKYHLHWLLQFFSPWNIFHCLFFSSAFFIFILWSLILHRISSNTVPMDACDIHLACLEFDVVVVSVVDFFILQRYDGKDN